MNHSSKWRAVLSASLAMLGMGLLLAGPGVHHPAASACAEAQGPDNPWPLTADGRSRIAAWSPDGRTLLVNRWGAVVGDGATRQALGELWAVNVRGGPAARLSENAIRPAYAPDGRRLAYLAFAGNGRWEIRVLNLLNGRQEALADADWRMPPTWVDGEPAFARAGQVWLGDKRAQAVPPGVHVRLSAAGYAAWSDGTRLWVQPGPGAEPRLLVTDALGLDLAWSPDGRRLAYVVASADLTPALWVADVADGATPVLLALGRPAEMFGTPAWSPDGRALAFSRTPLGAETASASDIWLVDVDGAGLRLLLRNDLEESNPAWSPDGRYLAFERAGDVWVLDLTRPLATPSTLAQPQERDLLSPSAQQTPPATIRVIHRAANYYRSDVPEGQIDVIPLEDYVKRVVPVEMPASWPIEALKAQAMAARTYAWYYTIEHAGWSWDVSDWTDYQVMGRDDQRHTRSDAATDDTRGQYVAYQGNVIKAFYSAENGCPTRSATGYPYIQAVDDPVSFGRTRYGHGWGMSQWGARRWAEWYGWGYQQILMHYYTGVTVELPATGGPVPIGAVTLPWSGFFVTGNRVYIAANASDEAGDVSAVGFYAVTETATLLVTDTVGSDGWSTVWDVSALGDTTSTGITLALRVADGAGNVQSPGETARIGLDRRPPVSATGTIGGEYAETFTVTLSALSATDPSPGSGVQAMAFSNENWAWEGEALYHQSGEMVTDTDALNGRAWRGRAGVHAPGAWYGPYTTVLPPGYAYRAYFRLKTGDALTTTEVATLDVVDDAGTRLLGLRRLRGTDFRAADTYQEFAVDFNYTDVGSAGLEFRTAFRATADLYLDRVLVVGYPISLATSAQWRLSPGEGLKTVTVKFIDGAGNVSADLTTTVTLSDTSPPTGWRDFACDWQGGWSALTCTVRVLDEISGLNVDSARYRFSTDAGTSWSDWLTATCTGISGTTELQTITASGVSFGEPSGANNRIEFQIADMKGYTGTAAYTLYSNFLPLVMKEAAPVGHIQEERIEVRWAEKMAADFDQPHRDARGPAEPRALLVP